jgi:hypothetical protein
MPLGCTEHAIEIVSEGHKDCIQAGFCTHHCAKQWVDDMKDKLIKAVNDWVAGERPIMDNMPIEAHQFMRAEIKHLPH